MQISTIYIGVHSNEDNTATESGLKTCKKTSG